MVAVVVEEAAAAMEVAAAALGEVAAAGAAVMAAAGLLSTLPSHLAWALLHPSMVLTGGRRTL